MPELHHPSATCAGMEICSLFEDTHIAEVANKEPASGGPNYKRTSDQNFVL